MVDYARVCDGYVLDDVVRSFSDGLSCVPDSHSERCIGCRVAVRGGGKVLAVSRWISLLLPGHEGVGEGVGAGSQDGESSGLLTEVEPRQHWTELCRRGGCCGALSPNRRTPPWRIKSVIDAAVVGYLHTSI